MRRKPAQNTKPEVCFEARDGGKGRGSQPVDVEGKVGGEEWKRLQNEMTAAALTDRWRMCRSDRSDRFSPAVDAD